MQLFHLNWNITFSGDYNAERRISTHKSYGLFNSINNIGAQFKNSLMTIVVKMKTLDSFFSFLFESVAKFPLHFWQKLQVINTNLLFCDFTKFLFEWETICRFTT